MVILSTVTSDVRNETRFDALTKLMTPAGALRDQIEESKDSGLFDVANNHLSSSF
jgi:hypothetical protein